MLTSIEAGLWLALAGLWLAIILIASFTCLAAIRAANAIGRLFR